MSDSDSGSTSSSKSSKSSASSKTSKSSASTSSQSDQEEVFRRSKVYHESSSSDGEQIIGRTGGKTGIEEEPSEDEKPKITRSIIEESSSGKESGENGKTGRKIAEESDSSSSSSEEEKPKVGGGRKIAESSSSESESSQEEVGKTGRRAIAQSDSDTSSSASTSTSRSSASSKSSKSSKSSQSKKSNASGVTSDSSSSSDSSDTDSEAKQRANDDTLKKDKPIDVDDVKLIEKDKNISDMKFEDPNANNFWVRLGNRLDRIYYYKHTFALTGLWSILLCVVFSILCNLSLSGYGIPYGVSFIFLLILFLFWAFVFTTFALSRFRYMLNLMPLPGTESLFDKRYFNKEGCRVASFFCVVICFILLFIHLILISVHLDKSSTPWGSWGPVFIPIWIALAFLVIGFGFSARLLKSWVSVIIFIVLVSCIIAQTIIILVKINGHISQKWYKALVPLWLMNFAALILIFWHAAARAVFNSLPHFINMAHKSKKERPPVDSCRDQAAALPFSVAAVFFFLFQVTCVIKAEGVKYVRYNIPWSLVWLWFWIGCAFLAIWVVLFRVQSDSPQMKRVSNRP